MKDWDTWGGAILTLLGLLFGVGFICSLFNHEFGSKLMIIAFIGVFITFFGMIILGFFVEK